MDQDSYDLLKICFFIIIFWVFYAIFGFEIAAITGLACIIGIIW